MNLPSKYDFINFHDHGSLSAEGVFSIDTIMAHEGREPGNNRGISYTVGAHPWNLDEDNIESLLFRVKDMSSSPNLFGIGETGFDKVKGPELALQERAFEWHAMLAEELKKPLVIHCVRAWPEIVEAKKRLKPSMPWIIHGFKGKKELALQLTDKGFWLSAWVEWAIRPVSKETLRAMPVERLFLETDGFDIGIEPVYRVVAGYIGIELEQLKRQIFDNFMELVDSKQ